MCVYVRMCACARGRGRGREDGRVWVEEKSESSSRRAESFCLPTIKTGDCLCPTAASQRSNSSRSRSSSSSRRKRAFCQFCCFHRSTLTLHSTVSIHLPGWKKQTNSERFEIHNLLSSHQPPSTRLLVPHLFLFLLFSLPFFPQPCFYLHPTPSHRPSSSPRSPSCFSSCRSFSSLSFPRRSPHSISR